MSTQVQSAPSVSTAVAGTGAVTILAASGDALVSRDLVSLVVTTINAAAGTLTLKCGARTVSVLDYPNAAVAPGTPLALQFCDVPLQGDPNAAWTLTASVNASGYKVTAQYTERQ